MIQPVGSVSGLTTRNGMSHSAHTLASETESVPNVQTHGVTGCWKVISSIALATPTVHPGEAA